MSPDRVPSRTAGRLTCLVPILVSTSIAAAVLSGGHDPQPSAFTRPGNAGHQQDAADNARKRTIPAETAQAGASSVPIRGGRYVIGSDQGGSDERPVHTVVFAPFRIGRFEVTNTQFARFLNSLGVQPRADADAGEVGVHDLAGNVDEWTSTLHRRYPYRHGDERERARSDDERVTRGGNHVYSSASELRSAYRAGFSREPDRGHRHIGFRVAYPARIEGDRPPHTGCRARESKENP